MVYQGGRKEERNISAARECLIKFWAEEGGEASGNGPVGGREGGREGGKSMEGRRRFPQK